MKHTGDENIDKKINEYIQALESSSKAISQNPIPLTLRQKANAVAYAMREPLEPIHASVISLDEVGKNKISETEMKNLMIEVCDQIFIMKYLEENVPHIYEALLVTIHFFYTKDWK